MTTLRNILIVLNIVSLYFVYENWQEKKKGVIIEYKEVNNQRVISECYIKPKNLKSNKDLISLFNKLKKEDFVNYPTVAFIPDFMLAFLRCSSKNDFSIANPGENWNAGCGELNGLADRQLINFKMGNKFAILTYAIGGIGVTRHILILEFDQKEVVNVWSPFIFLSPELQDENMLEYLKTVEYEYWRPTYIH